GAGVGRVRPPAGRGRVTAARGLARAGAGGELERHRQQRSARQLSLRVDEHATGADVGRPRGRGTLAGDERNPQRSRIAGLCRAHARPPRDAATLWSLVTAPRSRSQGAGGRRSAPPTRRGRAGSARATNRAARGQRAGVQTFREYRPDVSKVARFMLPVRRMPPVAPANSAVRPAIGVIESKTKSSICTAPQVWSAPCKPTVLLRCFRRWVFCSSG